MLSYEFMRHAFIAGTIVALVCGCIGYFLVLRQQSFAGHALGHVGFAGATGAVLLGISPLYGLLALTVAGGALMGALGEHLAERDVAVGMVLSASLGLGLLFMSFFTGSAGGATALLFGNVLGVDAPTLWRMAAIALFALLALSIIARPLLLASLRPELAAARGVDPRLLSVLFLALAGVAVAEAVQVVGVLLVFTLMIGPAAAAQLCTARFGRGVALAVLLAWAQASGGIALAYWTDWPTSFWISVLSGGCYVGAVVGRKKALLF